MAPGLDRRTRVGKGCPWCCPQWLGSQNSGGFSVFTGKCWLGLGHPLPATPSSSSGPSGFPPLFLLSPVTDSKPGGNSPLSCPCQPWDISCSVGSPQFPPQPIPEGPEELNRFSLGVFSPAAIFTGLISHPGLKKEGGFAACAAQGRRA